MSNKTVYVLTASDELAAASDYGVGWERAWMDADGKRLLPFINPPDGFETLTVEEARAHMAIYTTGDVV